jgi:predicted dehydrogenase
MLKHDPISVLMAGDAGFAGFAAFQAYLRAMPHVRLRVAEQVADLPPAADAVLTVGNLRRIGDTSHLENFAASGGAWLHLLGPSDASLPNAFGVQPGPAGPHTELRVQFADPGHPMAVRLPDTVYLHGTKRELTPVADNVETVLLADWRFSRQEVLVSRPLGRGRTACTTLQSLDDPIFQQILYRLIRYSCGHTLESSLRVGILGFAPSVGRFHGLGVGATPGLRLTAVCDRDPERLTSAAQDFPHLTFHASADAMAADPDVDLVVVATPPNTHADLCIAMMSAGKHVVCEKPLAFCRKETDRMIDSAVRGGVHLSCHQNRRFDEDYLTIKKTVCENAIGELFYMETFVGGFGHPCSHWHSHAPICGGTAYDWGAHYLDWIVGLIPDRVTEVVGTRHKHVWHDVTNADQERIQIRFAGGQEAEFLHSDIAAIRKPKWYLLGTGGAIVGDWRDTIVYRSDPDNYFQWDEIPPTEMPPKLRIYRRRPGGDIERTEPSMFGTDSPTFLPRHRPVRYPFHRNLADHLLTGEPIAAPLADSVKVVAILEAASRSMVNGGKVEVLDG